MAMTADSFDPSTLNHLAREVAEFVTHPELSRLLAECSIAEDGGSPKWERLDRAWSKQQARDGCANSVVRFLLVVLRPMRYVRREEDFARHCDSVNRLLAFAGLHIGADGKARRVVAAHTLGESRQRTDSLRSKLEQRQVHPDVFHFCRSELLQENYFHAVLEASKSIAEKLRIKTGIGVDGAELVDGALGGSPPILAINTLQSDTEKSEQRGFCNLLKGIFGTFRNVTAHAPKVCWAIKEADALDMLSTMSYVHRRLDESVRIR